MEYRTLGDSGIEVSLIGLGTMTWGEQNSERDAHEQIDYAIGQGVTLIDAAEMYPVPPKPDTQGRTEAYIGTWLAQHRAQRERIVLATKIAGPARQPHNPRHIRGEGNQFDRKNLTEALDGSLKRLQTDYVDLYQLHWPDRSTTTFGRPAYPWVDDAYTVPIEETLGVLAEFVKAGKVRAIGVSNETPWGVAQFLRAAEKLGLPRIASIQNPYSLLNRTFENGLSEFTHRDGVGLLAYSPLAFGWLSGKYASGRRPHHVVRTLPALQQAAGRRGDVALCRARTASRAVARAARAGVRQQPAVHAQQPDRGDVARAVEGEHRQRRREAVRRDPRRDRRAARTAAESCALTGSRWRPARAAAMPRRAAPAAHRRAVGCSVIAS